MVKPKLLWNYFKDVRDNSFTVIFPENYFLSPSLTTVKVSITARKQI